MKSILLFLTLLITTATFAQAAKKEAPKPVKKDSAQVSTPLLSFADIQELENFMKENLLIKDMPIFNGVLDFLRKKVQAKAVEYNSKLK